MGSLRRILSALFTAKPVEKTSFANRPHQTGRALRARALSTTAEQLHFQPTEDFPRVFGVVMDFPSDEDTATVVSMSDGTASLYTTAAFGIIGGGAHELVRAASQRFVKLAESFHDDSIPVKAWPYPANSQAFFYLLTYVGVRRISADLDQIYAFSSEHSPLFGAGQDVLTELRRIVDRHS